MKKMYFLLLSLMLISCNQRKSNTDSSDSDSIESDTVESIQNVESDSLWGCLHGESNSRNENFDSIKDVNVDNVKKLYALYDVDSLFDGEFYKVESKKIYVNAKYFTRLLHFKEGHQTSAVTFYGYSLKEIIPFDGNKVLVALNSLPYTGFSFQCKTVLLSDELVPIKGQMFKAIKGEFCFIDTLYANNLGFTVEISDEVFDWGIINKQIVQLDKNNRILKYENQKVDFE